MQRFFCVALACTLMLLTCIGCSDAEKYGLGDDDDSCPVSSIALTEAEVVQISDKMPIRLYFANGDNTKLKLEIRYIPVSEGNKSVNHLAQIIVNELIAGPKVAGIKPTIPKDSKLKSEIEINGEVATVNFTKEFRDDHPGGKAQERMTIYSIVNSLTELKEISKVKFLIEDKSSPEFKGNFKFDGVFLRCAQLISTKSEPMGMGDAEGESYGGRNEGENDKGVEEPDGDETKDKERQTGAEAVDEDEVFWGTPEDDEKWQESFEEEYEQTYTEYLY